MRKQITLSPVQILTITQLNSSNSDSVADLSGLEKICAPYSPPLIGHPFEYLSGKVEVDYDSGDLVFGQLINVGSRVTLHPFVGARYASIDYKATGRYSTPSDTEPDNAYLILKSDFQGVGPRLGSDVAVNLGSGFSLYHFLIASSLSQKSIFPCAFNASLYAG